MAEQESVSTEAETEEAAGTEKTQAAETSQAPARRSDAQAEDIDREAPADPPTYWPDDWREKIAEHAGAGDKKIVARELKRLQRYADPMGIYGSARELESKLTEGGLTKVPGENADEKEIAAYRKATGVPENAGDYVDNLQLDDGMIVGDGDKSAIDFYARIAHESGMHPSAFNSLVKGYYESQEEQASQLDQSDDNYRNQSSQALSEDYGASMDRNIRSLSRLFADTPGGADLKNPESLMSLIFGARLANGTLAGDNPDVIRTLVNWTRTMYPLAAVTEGGDQSGRSVDTELAEIRNTMRTDRRSYNKDTAMQARYRELLEAQQANRAHNA